MHTNLLTVKPSYKILKLTRILKIMSSLFHKTCCLERFLSPMHLAIFLVRIDKDRKKCVMVTLGNHGPSNRKRLKCTANASINSVFKDKDRAYICSYAFLYTGTIQYRYVIISYTCCYRSCNRNVRSHWGDRILGLEIVFISSNFFFISADSAEN